MESTDLQIVAKTDEEKNALVAYLGLDRIGDLKPLLQHAKEIAVTDSSQTEMISDARKTRLGLKCIRTAIEAKRKELKEGLVLHGKAIDGMANFFKDMIIPAEQWLENQEKYVELQETNRLDDLERTRVSLLAPYVAEVGIYNLRMMSEQGFEQLLKSLKTAFEAQKEAERKAELERKQREEESKKESDRIRAENEQLKAKAEAESQARKKAEEEASKIKREQEAKEKAEADKKAKEERERKESEEKAKRAPDKTKMEELCLAIAGIQTPKVKSEYAQATVDTVVSKLAETIKYLKERLAKI